MNHTSRLFSFAWTAVLAVALGFLIWTNSFRVRHIEYASSVAEAVSADQAGWQPRLVVPEHNNPTYEWLDQTRQMFARGEARVRHIDYENAPFGRTVYASSPYRWWLGLIAKCDQQLSGRRIGFSLERAAVIADPLIHLLLLIGTCVFVARRFGISAAALMALGLAMLYPLVSSFLPGMPEEHGFAEACGLWSILLLLSGLSAKRAANAADQERIARRWFFAAGVVGGVSLWISVIHAVPGIFGIAFGATLAALAARADAKTKAPTVPVLPWRAWGFGGAITVLVTYLIEYFPNHMGDWQFRAIHPLYGVAWLGGAELLARVTAWIRGQKFGRSRRDFIIAAAAVIALGVIPVILWKQKSLGFLEIDLPALRLTRLPGGASATNTFAWLLNDKMTGAFFATTVPLILLGPVVWLLLRRGLAAQHRVSLALALGPVFVAMGFACRQLRWWNGVDAALLVLVVVATVAFQALTDSRRRLWMWCGMVAIVLLPGAIQMLPRDDAGSNTELNEGEVFALIERDLGRWLALHAGTGTVVLAPHNLSTTFHYYGGLRGLPTFGWENREGLSGAVRILSASTPEEAKLLIDRRNIRFIVMPSWDTYLDVYARMGMGQLDGTFMNNLIHWKLPPWLRPVAYQVPTISGFEAQTVRILEVVEDQDDAGALNRTAEYFVEMGQLNEAAAVAQALRRFPANLGAWVARAEVETARSDEEGLAVSLKVLLPKIKAKADRTLTWDIRVGLAAVLARAKHMDLAKDQVARCLATADDSKLRALSTGALYRLMVLARAFDLKFSDSKLQTVALQLLPADMRSRVVAPK